MHKQINIQIDENLYDESRELFRRFGLSLRQAIELFLVLQKKRILYPLKFRYLRNKKILLPLQLVLLRYLEHYQRQKVK